MNQRIVDLLKDWVGATQRARKVLSDLPLPIELPPAAQDEEGFLLRLEHARRLLMEAPLADAVGGQEQAALNEGLALLILARDQIAVLHNQAKDSESKVEEWRLVAAVPIIHLAEINLLTVAREQRKRKQDE